jgi:beta-lactamase class A
MIGRRPFLAGIAVSLAGPAFAWKQSPVVHALAELERTSGGQLGVAMLDTGSGRIAGHRLDERFTLCSTFKLLLAGQVLQAIDERLLDPERRLAFTEADFAGHAPAARRALDRGWLSVLEAAAAAQVESDNTAANLLLRELGGPAGFVAFMRSLGDDTTRLDRYEPELNLGPPEELRDSTTPRAIAAATARLLTGDALAQSSRDRLIGWMEATQTGLRRIRGGLPAGWRAGDKTGTAVHESMANKHNDLAIAYPPKRPPIIVAAYYEAPAFFERTRPQDDAVLASVGRLIPAFSAEAG